jgi:transcription elongation factor Elf1
MSLGKFSYKNSVKQKITKEQSSFYNQQNTCSLCGSELEITTVLVKDNVLQEKVSCSSCQINISSKDFTVN